MKCKWSYYKTLDYDLFRIERFNDLLLTKAWKVKHYVMMDCAEPEDLSFTEHRRFRGAEKRIDIFM